MKPKVKFVFDKEKDLDNIWETCNSKVLYGFDFRKDLSKEILKICRGKTFNSCKKRLEKKVRKVHNSKLINININAVNKAWKEIEGQYFKRIKNIMKKPYSPEKFVGYLTSIQRCPYDYNKSCFYFCWFHGIPGILKTAGHEIMHIYFHNTYWKEIEGKIGWKKTSDLKEALTVLLNLEFRDLWFVPDTGYSKHKKLRKFIEKQWKKKKDFDVLMKKCVTYLKKEGSR